MTNTKLDIHKVGKRIRDCRKQIGMTQEMLAEKSNLTPQFVSYAETGQREIRVGSLLKIAKSLNTSCDFLLTGERIDKDLLLLSKKMSQLDEIEFTLVSRLVDDLLQLYHNHTDK